MASSNVHKSNEKLLFLQSFPNKSGIRQYISSFTAPFPMFCNLDKLVEVATIPAYVRVKAIPLFIKYIKIVSLTIDSYNKKRYL